MRTAHWVAAAIGLYGCNGSADPTLEAEPNDLGILRLEIGRHSEDDNAVVEIRGFDRWGQEIALATLRTGTVQHSYEPGVLPGEDTPGRDLTITVLGVTYHEVIPDFLPIENEQASPNVARFVQLRAVAAQLKAANISFKSNPSEVPYSWQGFMACDPRAFLPGSGSPQSCWGYATELSGGGYAYGALAAFGNNTLYNRSATSGNGGELGSVKPCRNTDLTVGCGQGSNQCYFGPCGFKTATYAGLPSGYPKIWGNAGSWSYDMGNGLQNVWTGQALAPSVSGECTCTSCRADGTPLPLGCTNAAAASTCGDSVCTGIESCATCSQDCGSCPFCGDSTCGAASGENCDTCSQDCGECPFCGDATCNEGEDCSSCEADCGACVQCEAEYDCPTWWDYCQSNSDPQCACASAFCSW